MFGKCVPIQKNRVGYFVLYTFNLIMPFHQTLKWGFPNRNKGLFVDFGILTLLLLSREKRKAVAQASTQHGDTGLQKRAANLYIIIFWMWIYIYITVICAACVQFQLFFCFFFFVWTRPEYVFFFFLYMDYKGSESNEEQSSSPSTWEKK